MEKIYPIEERYHLDELHQLLVSHKEYRGLITANNAPIGNPKVLFIGYNPGPGLYYASGKNTSKVIRTFKEKSLNELDWISKGSLREGEWHNQKSKYKKNNTFIKNLVRFLKTYYYIDDVQLHKNEDYRKEKEVTINAEIFSWNIYPIATEKGKQLRAIIQSLNNRNPIQEWKKVTDQENIDLSNFFRQRTIDLINDLKPTHVICLGSTTFKEMTCKPLIFSKDEFFAVENVTLRKDSPPTRLYVINRRGNWENRIKKLAERLR